MTEWFDPKDKLPDDKQECLLMPPEREMVTTPIFGPIMWRAKDGVWLDIFRDPEAGTVVKVEQVGLWCDWQSIAPKENGER